jgi:hypothetical protein
MTNLIRHHHSSLTNLQMDLEICIPAASSQNWLTVSAQAGESQILNIESSKTRWA